MKSAIVDHAHTAVVVADAAGRIVEFNPAAEAMLRCPREQALGQTVRELLSPERSFEFFADDTEFYQTAARTPRSNCVLDVSKLLGTGVKIRSVEEAVADSLNHWQPAAP